MIMESYNGVKVIEENSKFFNGRYRNGVIYVKSGLCGEDLKRTLSHEYQHYLFERKFPIQKLWDNKIIAVTLHGIGLIFLIQHNPAGFVFFIPAGILALHEFFIFFTMRDFRLPFFKRLFLSAISFLAINFIYTA